MFCIYPLHNAIGAGCVWIINMRYNVSHLYHVVLIRVRFINAT